eukprot:947194-Alexandrium_andersonii.AAC.1
MSGESPDRSEEDSKTEYFAIGASRRRFLALNGAWPPRCWRPSQEPRATQCRSARLQPQPELH